MVIGGLISDNVTSSTSKVPFLGDIPILGWFFQSKTTSIDKTNLMIFITPYIINNEDEAGDLTKWKNNTLTEFRKENRIEKKGVSPVIPSRKTSSAAEAPASELKSNEVPTTPAPAAQPKKMETPASEIKSNAATTVPANVGPTKEVAKPVTELKSGVSDTAPIKTAPVMQPIPELKSNPVPTTQLPAPAGIPKEGVR